MYNVVYICLVRTFLHLYVYIFSPHTNVVNTINVDSTLTIMYVYVWIV